MHYRCIHIAPYRYILLRIAPYRYIVFHVTAYRYISYHSIYLHIATSCYIATHRCIILNITMYRSTSLDIVPYHRISLHIAPIVVYRSALLISLHSAHIGIAASSDPYGCTTLLATCSISLHIVTYRCISGRIALYYSIAPCCSILYRSISLHIGTYCSIPRHFATCRSTSSIPTYCIDPYCCISLRIDRYRHISQHIAIFLQEI